MLVGAAAYKAISAANLPGDADAIGKLHSAMTSRLTFKLVSAVYTDLTSTGNLALIRSHELRDNIVGYFAEAQRIELIIEKNNQVFVDDLFMPFLLEIGITARPVTEQALQVLSESDMAVIDLLGPEYVLPGDSVLSHPPEDDSWNHIRRHVLLRMRVSSVGKNQAERVRAATRELRAILEQELAEN
jgi:hypothetical protein